jgi:hypothetical protein
MILDFSLPKHTNDYLNVYKVLANLREDLMAWRVVWSIFFY